MDVFSHDGEKTTEYFKTQGKEIILDAVPASEGDKMIQESDFDLFLISPQTKMYLDQFKKVGEKVSKPVGDIPFQAYIPVLTGIEKIAELVLENF